MNLIDLLIVIESVPLFSAQTLVALRVSKKICAIFDAIEIQAFYNMNLNPSTSCPIQPIRVLIHRQHALRQSVVLSNASFVCCL